MERRTEDPENLITTYKVAISQNRQNQKCDFEEGRSTYLKGTEIIKRATERQELNTDAYL